MFSSSEAEMASSNFLDLKISEYEYVQTQQTQNKLKKFKEDYPEGLGIDTFEPPDKSFDNKRRSINDTDVSTRLIGERGDNQLNFKNTLYQIEPALAGQSTTYLLKKDGREIYSFFVSTNSWSPYYLFEVFNSTWVLDLGGEIILNGKSLNNLYGYDETFSFEMLNGVPFFLFKKDNKFGLFYKSREYSGKYDDIVRYACCEYGVFNPMSDNHAVEFTARKKNTWYGVLVESLRN